MLASSNSSSSSTGPAEPSAAPAEPSGGPAEPSAAPATPPPGPAAGEMVVVAMSGGVDSSVAAALLVESGYRVIGVTLRLWCEGDEETAVAAPQPTSKTCCSLQDVADARRVAAQLDIPHYVLDMRHGFDERVITPFVAEYARGRTPNPCVECNTHLKFGRLLELAGSLGARLVATGHHARRVLEEGEPAILRGTDRRKDQSYVLWGIRRAVLGRVLLPVGELDKAEVRRRASALDLSVADKPDSQDICFVPAGRYADFVRGRLGDAVAPGAIEDLAGNRLGEHRGIVDFTIGQRRGLGLSAPEPLYVVGIEPETRTVRVGPASALETDRVRVAGLNLLWEEALAAGESLAVQVRAGSEAHPARVRDRGEAWLEFLLEAPVRAVVPGQSAAFYQGDRLLGGGVIDAPWRPGASPGAG